MEIAIAHVNMAGFSSIHTHLRRPSFVALPQLCSENLKIDFAFIDGYHSFDHVFIDFFYCDQMLREGGLLAFDDASWRSVFKVIRFLSTHRKYVELDVGLKASYQSRNWLFSLIKRIQGRWGPTRFFQKISNWQPAFNFYANF